MNNQKAKQIRNKRRHVKIRSKIFGTSIRPRLSVFRSNKSMYLQLIDDAEGKTLASAGGNDLSVKATKNKTDIGFELGKKIAEKAIDPKKNKTGKKIEKVIFDRGGYKYHGRVKAAAEGAREGGLKF